LWDLPPSLRSNLESAYELWAIADATRQFGGDPSLYRRAADAFGLVLDSVTNDILDPPLVRELSAIACTERGYLLSCTGESSDLLEAKVMYERGLVYEPRNPVAHFRLGQILFRTGKIAEAALHYREAIDSRKEDDIWLYDAARIALGLANWKMFHVRELSLDAREKALKEAIEVTRSVYTDSMDRSVRSSALNNLVYYSWEERIHSEHESHWQISGQEFERLVDELAIENESSPNRSVQVEDTLLRAYSHMGDDKRAVLYATRVQDLLAAIEEDLPRRSELPSDWLVNSLPKPKMNQAGS
jgi:tetratricopeptide (TPR) repeat protein